MRASLWVVPAYFVATLAITWPLAREFSTALPAVFNSVDPLLQAFILGWDRHALATDILHIFDAPMFYPEHRTLAYMDHLLGEAVLSGPVAFVTGSAAAAYNSVVVASFVAAGWAAYRLVRALGASRAAAFVSGLLYAFAPYRLSNLGNLNQLQTALVPLGMLFALRFAARRRTRDLACTFAVVALQSCFGWYATYHLSLGLAITLACAPGFGWPGGNPVPWRRLGVATALALIVMLPGALPYWRQYASMPGFRRTLGKAAIYSADLLDYVKLNRENALGKALHLPRGDLAYAIGAVTVVLALAGLRWGNRTRVGPDIGSIPTSKMGNAAPVSLRDSGPSPVSAPPLGLRHFGAYLAILAGSAFVLSLGPILQIAGRRLPVPLPYAVLYFIVPAFNSMRAPGRFAELVLVVAVIVAARGYDALRARARGGATTLLAATVVAVLVTEWSAPIPMVVYPTHASLPPAYAFIAHQPGRFAILELPMPASEADEGERDAVRQLWSLDHGKARIDGVSGFSSPAHESFRALMRSFPDPLAVAAIVERGARFVVVRYGEYAPEEAARIRHEFAAAPELAPVFSSAHDVVYAVVHATLLARSRGHDRHCRGPRTGAPA